MAELDILKRPEYIRLTLNYLPIYGTILGALALAISLVLRSRAAQTTALILTLIAGVSAYRAPSAAVGENITWLLIVVVVRWPACFTGRQRGSSQFGTSSLA